MKNWFLLFLFSPILLSACSSQKSRAETAVAEKIKLAYVRELPPWISVSGVKCNITAQAGLDFTCTVVVTTVTTEDVFRRTTDKGDRVVTQFVAGIGVSDGKIPASVAGIYDAWVQEASLASRGYLKILPEGEKSVSNVAMDGRIVGDGVELIRAGKLSVFGPDSDVAWVIPKSQLPTGARFYKAQDEADRTFEKILAEKLPAAIEKARQILLAEAERNVREAEREARVKAEGMAAVAAAFPVGQEFAGNLRYFGNYSIKLEVTKSDENAFVVRIALKDRPSVQQIFRGSGQIKDGLPVLELSPTEEHGDYGMVPPIFKSGRGSLRLVRNGGEIEGEANSGGNGSTLTLAP